MQPAHRRTDTALTIIAVILAAVLVGMGIYAIAWHFILPLLGVDPCQ